MAGSSPLYTNQKPYTTWINFFDQMKTMSLNTHVKLGSELCKLSVEVNKDRKRHENAFNVIKGKLRIADPFGEAEKNIQESKKKAREAIKAFMKTKEEQAVNKKKKKGKQGKKNWLKCFTKATNQIQHYKLELRRANEIANDFNSQIMTPLQDLQNEEVVRQTTMKNHMDKWSTIHLKVIAKNRETDIYGNLVKKVTDLRPMQDVQDLIKVCQKQKQATAYKYQLPNYHLLENNSSAEDIRGEFCKRYNLHWFGYELTTPSEFWMSTQQLSSFEGIEKEVPKYELFNCTLEEVIDFQNYYSITLAEQIDTPIILEVTSLEIMGHARKAWLCSEVDSWQKQWYREQLESGNYRSASPSPEIAAHILVTWLDELPESLIPFPLHTKCIRTLGSVDKVKREANLRYVMKRVPALNWKVIDRLLNFIKEAIGIIVIDTNEPKEPVALEKALKDPALPKICKRIIPFLFQKDDKHGDFEKWLTWLIEYSCSAEWKDTMSSGISSPKTNKSGALHKCTRPGCTKPRFKGKLCATHENGGDLIGDGSDDSGDDEDNTNLPGRPSTEMDLKLNLEASSKEAKKQMKRSKVWGEIIETEDRYVKALTLLEDYWVTPLKNKSTAKSLKLNHKDVVALTSNISAIQKMQKQFLEALEKEKPSTIPRVFNQYHKFFKMYCRYLNHYEVMLNTMTRLRAKNKKFAAWFQDTETQIREEGAKLFGIEEMLTSHFIKPVQRIPRYVLLLRELKKYTDPEDPAYEELVLAMDNIRSVATEINIAKKKMENMTQLLEIQTKIVGYQGECLMQPQRVLVREGELIVPDGLGKTVSKPAPRKVLLFSDIIIWTSILYTYKGQIDLTGASLSVLQNQDLQIVSTNDILYLRCAKKVRDAWIADISRTIRKQRQNKAKQYRTARPKGARPRRHTSTDTSNFSNSIRSYEALPARAYTNDSLPRKKSFDLIRDLSSTSSTTTTTKTTHQYARTSMN